MPMTVQTYSSSPGSLPSRWCDLRTTSFPSQFSSLMAIPEVGMVWEEERRNHERECLWEEQMWAREEQERGEGERGGKEREVPILAKERTRARVAEEIGCIGEKRSAVAGGGDVRSCSPLYRHVGTTMEPESFSEYVFFPSVSSFSSVSSSTGVDDDEVPPSWRRRQGKEEVVNGAAGEDLCCKRCRDRASPMNAYFFLSEEKEIEMENAKEKEKERRRARGAKDGKRKWGRTPPREEGRTVEEEEEEATGVPHDDTSPPLPPPPLLLPSPSSPSTSASSFYSPFPCTSCDVGAATRKRDPQTQQTPWWKERSRRTDGKRRGGNGGSSSGVSPTRIPQEEEEGKEATRARQTLGTPPTRSTAERALPPSPGWPPCSPFPESGVSAPLFSYPNAGWLAGPPSSSPLPFSPSSLKDAGRTMTYAWWRWWAEVWCWHHGRRCSRWITRGITGYWRSRHEQRSSTSLERGDSVEKEEATRREEETEQNGGRGKRRREVFRQDGKEAKGALQENRNHECERRKKKNGIAETWRASGTAVYSAAATTSMTFMWKRVWRECGQVLTDACRAVEQAAIRCALLYFPPLRFLEHPPPPQTREDAEGGEEKKGIPFSCYDGSLQGISCSFVAVDKEEEGGTTTTSLTGMEDKEKKTLPVAVPVTLLPSFFFFTQKVAAAVREEVQNSFFTSASWHPVSTWWMRRCGHFYDPACPLPPVPIHSHPMALSSSSSSSSFLTEEEEERSCRRRQHFRRTRDMRKKYRVEDEKKKEKAAAAAAAATHMEETTRERAEENSQDKNTSKEEQEEKKHHHHQSDSVEAPSEQEKETKAEKAFMKREVKAWKKHLWRTLLTQPSPTVVGLSFPKEEEEKWEGRWRGQGAAPRMRMMVVQRVPQESPTTTHLHPETNDLDAEVPLLTTLPARDSWRRFTPCVSFFPACTFYTIPPLLRLGLLPFFLHAAREAWRWQEEEESWKRMTTKQQQKGEEMIGRPPPQRTRPPLHHHHHQHDDPSEIPVTAACFSRFSAPCFSSWTVDLWWIQWNGCPRNGPALSSTPTVEASVEEEASVAQSFLSLASLVTSFSTLYRNPSCTILPTSPSSSSGGSLSSFPFSSCSRYSHTFSPPPSTPSSCTPYSSPLESDVKHEKDVAKGESVHQVGAATAVHPRHRCSPPPPLFSSSFGSFLNGNEGGLSHPKSGTSTTDTLHWPCRCTTETTAGHAAVMLLGGVPTFRFYPHAPHAFSSSSISHDDYHYYHHPSSSSSFGVSLSPPIVVDKLVFMDWARREKKEHQRSIPRWWRREEKPATTPHLKSHVASEADGRSSSSTSSFTRSSSLWNAVNTFQSTWGSLCEQLQEETRQTRGDDVAHHRHAPRSGEERRRAHGHGPIFFSSFSTMGIPSSGAAPPAPPPPYGDSSGGMEEGPANLTSTGVATSSSTAGAPSLPLGSCASSMCGHHHPPHQEKRRETPLSHAGRRLRLLFPRVLATVRWVGGTVRPALPLLHPPPPLRSFWEEEEEEKEEKDSKRCGSKELPRGGVPLMRGAMTGKRKEVTAGWTMGREVVERRPISPVVMDPVDGISKRYDGREERQAEWETQQQEGRKTIRKNEEKRDEANTREEEENPTSCPPPPPLLSCSAISCDTPLVSKHWYSGILPCGSILMELHPRRISMEKRPPWYPPVLPSPAGWCTWRCFPDRHRWGGEEDGGGGGWERGRNRGRREVPQLVHIQILLLPPPPPQDSCVPPSSSLLPSLPLMMIYVCRTDDWRGGEVGMEGERWERREREMEDLDADDDTEEEEEVEEEEVGESPPRTKSPSFSSRMGRTSTTRTPFPPHYHNVVSESAGRDWILQHLCTPLPCLWIEWDDTGGTTNTVVSSTFPAEKNSSPKAFWKRPPSSHLHRRNEETPEGDISVLESVVMAGRWCSMVPSSCNASSPISTTHAEGEPRQRKRRRSSRHSYRCTSTSSSGCTRNEAEMESYPRGRREDSIGKMGISKKERKTLPLGFQSFPWMERGSEVSAAPCPVPPLFTTTPRRTTAGAEECGSLSDFSSPFTSSFSAAQRTEEQRTRVFSRGVKVLSVHGPPPSSCIREEEDSTDRMEDDSASAKWYKATIWRLVVG